MSDTPGRASKLLWIIITLIIAASAFGWFRLRVDSSLNPLLPETSDARATLEFLSESTLASKAILWFRCTDTGNPSDLFAAANAVEKRLDPKLIKSVIHPPQIADALPELFSMLDHAGELLTADDLSDIQAAMTPDALAAQMRDCYMHFMKPQDFDQQIIRRDPLGINMRIVNRFNDLRQGMGYKVDLKDGRLIHPDGRQLMLGLETSSTATGLVGSELVADHLRALAATAPPGIIITPIAPAQIHTQQNHQSMERDMKFASVIDTIAFILLFLVVGRDWRVGAVFLLPIITIVITIGLCALVYPELSMVVIGMAIPMAGSAVDYGIFVYTALWLGSNPTLDVRRIRRPLIISHLTTLGVFFAFLFSHIPAYRQLGCLTSISLVLSLLGALFVLPKMVRRGGKTMKMLPGIPLTIWGKRMIPCVLLGAILLIAGTALAVRVSFNADITQLDGISSDVRQAETDFQHNWARSDKDDALLVASAPTRAQAEGLNDKLNSLLAGKLHDGNMVSLTSAWPSAATRRANLARWTAYWSPQRIADFRAALATAGRPYGFSATAFDPFFDSLTTPPFTDTPPLISALEEPFVARAGDNWQMLNHFEDTDANVTAVRSIIKGITGAQVVSRQALSQAFAESAVSETHVLVSIAVSFIIVSLLVLTRSLTKSAIIMLPVLCGIVAMLAVMVLMSQAIGAISIVAAILVLALGSDYGIFALYAWDNNETTFGQGMAAVHLSSITTVIGTGALLFAHHPAMFLCGVTLTSGLFGGYLTAFFIVPGVCYLLNKKSSTT